MASIEGLQKNLDAVNSGLKTVQGVNEYTDRQKAAKTAAELYKSGDIKGAVSALAAVDPEYAKQIAPTLLANDPSTQGNLVGAKKNADLGAETGFNANPRQLLDSQLQNAKDIANINADAKKAVGSKPVIRKDENSPTGFSMITPQGGVMPFDAYGTSAMGAKSAAPTDAAKPADTAEPKPQEQVKLRPNQAIDSNGQAITLAPVQQKALNGIVKDFDSKTKDLVKGINDASQAVTMIQANTPGAQAVEKLRLLRSITPRINQQEFVAFGKGQGVEAQIENAISEASGKGMSPQVQKNMMAISQIALKNLNAEYDQSLKNQIEKADPTLDRYVIKQRLIGSGPTPYQATLQKVQQLPAEDQAAVNWAHDNATAKDPATQKQAAQILKMHGL